MLRIEKGGEYTATRVRSGENANGEWEMIVVKEESKAHREMTIFTTNHPCRVREGGRFKVVEITAASARRNKNRDGSWSLDSKLALEAEVEPTADDISTSDYDDMFSPDTDGNVDIFF